MSEGGDPSREPGDRVRPGDGILHPVALGALVVLALNDQVLKAAAPSPATGILSDVAGLIVTPLALVAVWELSSWWRGTWVGPTVPVLAIAITAVGVAFALLQIWPPATEAYRWGLGALQWPASALLEVVSGRGLPAVRPVVAVADTADLLALPALVVTWWLGRGRVRRWRAG